MIRVTDKSKLRIQIFTILSIVYYLMNILIPTDYSPDADNSMRIFPQIAAGLLSLYSILVCIISFHSLVHNKLSRRILLLFCISIIYIFYPFNPVSNATYVMRQFAALPTMCAEFCIFCSIKDKKYCILCLYLIFLFQLLFCFYTLYLDKVSALSANTAGFDSNAGFMLVTCIPMALIMPWKHLRLYSYSILILACIYCGQRSACLAALVTLPFCFRFIKGSINKTDIAIFLALTLIVFVPIALEAFQNLQVRNEIDQQRGYLGSGRSVFWLIVLQDFFSGDILHLLFGNGTNTVAPLLEATYGLAIGAHNGWLDFLYCYGFFGVAIYALVIFTILGNNRIVNKCLPWYKSLYLTMFLLFFVKATTSHGFFDVTTVPFTTVLAIVEGSITDGINKMKNYSHENPCC